MWDWCSKCGNLLDNFGNCPGCWMIESDTKRWERRQMSMDILDYWLSDYMVESDKGDTVIALKRLLSELDTRRKMAAFGGDEYIAVDIDGTIATKIRMGKYPEDYMKKQPIKGSIEGLRRLRRLGYKIMLFTARKEEDRSWTEGWLMSNGFSGLYDVLIMDKPWFTALIDDRAIGFTGDWDRAINEFKSRFYMGDEGQEK